ncbi:PP2C family protein-serine/threonine phosphatase [Mycolicibacterium hippocampi]|uniref:PP2C family protein-serine/threonine phosphatase n=1 Tax=Mycolicibacterium hippocampi TaxID=659824 RepID=UPI00351956AF
MTRQDIEDLWDHAPSGHLIADPQGRILHANSTLLRWLGYPPDVLHGKLISDLLTPGGRIHYETHFGPLLSMRGELAGVTVDLVAVDGARLPTFITANVKTDAAGRPMLLRITALDATDRRAFEHELREQRKRIEVEIGRVREFADTLRRSLLPPVLSPPPGLEAADYFRPASDDDVGGDFYDLFPLTRSTWGFFLGDVVGKGVEAAVVTGLARYVLRSAAVSDDDPVQVLRNLNSVLGQKLGIGNHRMCTLIYGNLTKRGNGFDVDLASGGHPPPLLIGGDGSALYADTIGGQAVGITQEPNFVASSLHLGPGDTLVFYTDGITEARTGRGHERFEDNGALLRFAAGCAPTTPAAIVEAIHGLLDGLGAGVDDDAAVLAFGVPS